MTLTLKPRISEQTYAQAEEKNVYVFVVPVSASKLEIKQAIEAQFKVIIENIRTSVIKGKAKKSYQKRAQPMSGKRTDYKKAYVTVKKGDKIPIYEEIN